MITAFNHVHLPRRLQLTQRTLQQGEIAEWVASPARFLNYVPAAAGGRTMRNATRGGVI